MCAREGRMSQYDLMKLFARYDSEVCEGDFTPEELEEYLAFCNGRVRPRPPNGSGRISKNTTT